ncbi:MAG: type II toxin-antitoxin system VapC family toxin [Candidatus Eremiobacterota bacterium]
MYLIDTNILIYYFNNSIPDKIKPVIKEIFQKHFNISIITRMEFLGFRGHTEESFEKARLFLSYSHIINLEDDIVEMVINLRRSKKMKLPDTIIASTAIKKDLILVTRNVDDFSDINIKFYNPFDIK